MRVPSQSLGALQMPVPGAPQAVTPIRSAKSGTSVPIRRRSSPSLLLKLLFTNKPLSIQVHPDDKFAISIGMPRGKSEAWYILSATPEAKVALGLKQQITTRQLRAAVDDGSISTLVAWHTVSQGEIIFVPAGTIHAIGAGLVIAEIQQRSDATFRMFDYGSKRELHIDSAIAVANTRPAVFSVQTTQATDERTILVSNPHFVFERLTLTPNSSWRLAAERETWLLVLSGGARIGSFVVGIGDGIFAQSDRVEILAGADGVVCLAAYTGGKPNFRSAAGPPKAGFIGPDSNVFSSRTGRPSERAPRNKSMKSVQRIAFIGNHLPRLCGIATFTHDLHRAVSMARPDLETGVVAMTDPGGAYDYPQAVRLEIQDDNVDSYIEAAEFLNNAGFDVVSLQHEYGIFGGPAGEQYHRSLVAT